MSFTDWPKQVFLAEETNTRREEKTTREAKPRTIRPLEVKVEDSTIVVHGEGEPYYFPWSSFDLYNDGPDPVYFAVNEDEPADEAPLRENESIEMGPSLDVERIALKCDFGKNTTVRIYPEKVK